MSVAEALRARNTVSLTKRPRRLRASRAMRDLVRETHVDVAHLVQPLFVAEEGAECGPIASMPGIRRHRVGEAVSECVELAQLGIRAVLLFGIPAHKDANASANFDPNGVVQRTIRAVKEAAADLVIIADLCNCEYTDHGHCGILTSAGDVDNDLTLDLLARTALTYAAAGVDAVAPSDMMDGRVGYLRSALDRDGFTGTAIMSYAAKFASAFYGPFREAAGSAMQFGDRRSYQMDPANAREALREVALDVEEGADVVMVKPALAYLDLIRAVRERFDVPIAAYNVSGEYAMVKAAAERGWIDEDAAVDELLTAFVRAGADIVITYFAKRYAQRTAHR